MQILFLSEILQITSPQILFHFYPQSTLLESNFASGKCRTFHPPQEARGGKGTVQHHGSPALTSIIQNSLKAKTSMEWEMCAQLQLEQTMHTRRLRCLSPRCNLTSVFLKRCWNDQKRLAPFFFDEKHKWLTFHTRSWNLWGGVVIWEASMSFENVWEKQMFPSAPDMNATPAPQFFQWTHPFPLLLFCIGWKIQIIGVGQGVDAKIIK